MNFNSAMKYFGESADRDFDIVPFKRMWSFKLTDIFYSDLYENWVYHNEDIGFYIPGRGRPNELIDALDMGHEVILKNIVGFLQPNHHGVLLLYDGNYEYTIRKNKEVKKLLNK